MYLQVATVGAPLIFGLLVLLSRANLRVLLGDLAKQSLKVLTLLRTVLTWPLAIDIGSMRFGDQNKCYRSSTSIDVSGSQPQFQGFCSRNRGPRVELAESPSPCLMAPLSFFREVI